MNKNIETYTKSEFNFLIKPLAILFTVIGLIILIVTFGIKQINSLKSKLDSAQKNQRLLEQKVDTLESVGQVLSGDVTFLDIVLPNKGAVLYGLSQIKNQALNFGVALSGLKTGGVIPESSGVYKTSISFDAEGDEQNIHLFLQSFSRVLPLMNVDKVSLNKTNTLTSASVSVSVFSSDLPKKIPAVTEAVNDFTREETDLLKEISSFTLPQFVEPSALQLESQKANPFN